MVIAWTAIVALAALHWMARLADLVRRARSAFTLRPGPAPPPPPGGWEPVSVLIPARDEEARIGRALRTVLAQTLPPREVIVLDDGSTDGTADVVDDVARDDPRVRRVPGAPLPPGWKGKCHALHQAAREARSPWLLLLDADVELHPTALEVAMAFARDQGSPLVSWFGTTVAVTAWERVLQPFVMDLITTHADPARIADPARPDAIANGQFILIRADVYRELGGHAAVRASIVEDMALARRAKAAGHRLRLAEAYGLMATRMYRNLGEIWAGWTKNFFAGLHGRADAVAAALLHLLVTGMVPHASLAAALLLAALGAVHGPLLGASLLAVGLQIAYRLAIARRTSPPSLLSVLAHPLAAAVLALIILDSARRAVTGVPVSWKGRSYQAGSASASPAEEPAAPDGAGDPP